MESILSMRSDTIATQAGSVHSPLSLSNTVQLSFQVESRVESKSVTSLRSLVPCRPLLTRSLGSVIAVPGYCTPAVSTWGMTNEFEQAATSIDSVSRLHMYIYEPNFESTENFSWEGFLKAGSDLAEELARLVTEVC